jgi:RNA polymerase sigma-70 factor (ECF subfamily)
VPAADADDVTQEVMLAMHCGALSFRVPEDRTPERARGAWGFGIVRNQVASYRRARAREPGSATPEALDEGTLGAAGLSPEAELIRRRALAAAADIVSALDPRLRAVFLAHDILGAGMAEIASELDAPANTAWDLLRRARAAIRACVQRRNAEEQSRERKSRRRAARS